MKKTIILTLTIISLFPNLFAQMNPIIENASSLVWYGLDYTNTRFIGTEKFSDPEINIAEYYTKWNDVFVKEDGKYNLKDAFNVENVYNNLTIVGERNAQINLANKITDTKFILTEEDIKKTVSEINFPETAGLGLICIVETLNYNDREATAFFTFVDLSTKEILYIKWMKGASGGSGFRNYWINPFANMLEEWMEVFR